MSATALPINVKGTLPAILQYSANDDAENLRSLYKLFPSTHPEGIYKKSFDEFCTNAELVIDIAKNLVAFTKKKHSQQ